MIVALLLVVFILITFSQIGLAALIVIPVTFAMVAGLFSFFAMLGGVEGAGGIFLWCAVITGAFFGTVYIIGKSGGP